MGEVYDTNWDVMNDDVSIGGWRLFSSYFQLCYFLFRVVAELVLVENFLFIFRFRMSALMRGHAVEGLCASSSNPLTS